MFVIGPVIQICHHFNAMIGSIQPCALHKQSSLCIVLGWIEPIVALRVIGNMRFSLHVNSLLFVAKLYVAYILSMNLLMTYMSCV